jgi:hypothetical protein
MSSAAEKRLGQGGKRACLSLSNCNHRSLARLYPWTKHHQSPFCCHPSLLRSSISDLFSTDSCVQREQSGEIARIRCLLVLSLTACCSVLYLFPTLQNTVAVDYSITVRITALAIISSLYFLVHTKTTQIHGTVQSTLKKQKGILCIFKGKFRAIVL